MDPGSNYRVDLWIQAGIQGGSMDSGKDSGKDHISRAIGMDDRMFRCIQVWITGWIYGSMYPGMDYRMNPRIYVSRNGLRMVPWIYVFRYGCHDLTMDLCIQVWIQGWIYVFRYGL